MMCWGFNEGYSAGASNSVAAPREASIYVPILSIGLAVGMAYIEQSSPVLGANLRCK